MDVLQDVIGTLAVIFATVCALPQVVKTMKTKDTKGISLWMFLILMTSIALWLVYGLMIGEWPIIVANAISLGLTSTILVMKLRYG